MFEGSDGHLEPGLRPIGLVIFDTGDHAKSNTMLTCNNSHNFGCLIILDVWGIDLVAQQQDIITRLSYQSFGNFKGSSLFYTHHDPMYLSFTKSQIKCSHHCSMKLD